MAFNTYNNNQQDRRPTVQTFTPITFSNPESKVCQSRFSVSYFNNLMKIDIAPRINQGSNDQFAKYDNDNPVTVYVSYTKAKILHDAIMHMINNSDIHNVCIELKNGLLRVSDGVEFGSQNFCIAITYAANNGNDTNTIIYETKTDPYYAAYNYKDNQYSTLQYPQTEINTFIMVLEQYYLASSYAVAATVKESNMYMNNGRKNLLNAMAEKLGVDTKSNNGSNGQGFQNRSQFISNNGGNNSQPVASSGFNGGEMTGAAPKEFESSTFDAIVSSMTD